MVKQKHEVVVSLVHKWNRKQHKKLRWYGHDLKLDENVWMERCMGC